MKRGLFYPLVAVSLLVGPGLARAQLPNEGALCRANEPRMDKYGYLRSLMLDLTGTVPTPEDYARLDAEDDVPEAWIDALLASEAFVGRAVRIHRAFLWNNVDNVTLHNFQTSLTRTGSLYWRRTPAVRYRGDDVPCLDQPATFAPDGSVEYTTDAQGLRREGYVMVQPYWALDTEIKVCAFDAQARAISPSGTDCATSGGFTDVGCGCGPNLRACRYGSTVAINQAMAGDVERRIAAVVREDRPYTELFEGREAYVNGPLVHYLKYQTGVPAGVRVTPDQIKADRLPDLTWSQADTWQKISLDPGHAGILTSLSFLLRFQTNRARASRFYDAFLCQPFSPPPGGLPPVDPNVLPHPDLQQRDGCKYCHALLEPAASHWGRWTERGAGYLEPTRYPATREDCRECGTTGRLCSRECRLYYITTPYSSLEEPYVGALNAFGFLRPEHTRNVELGPKFLVASSVVDDRFPKCSARRAMQGLFGRPLQGEEEAALGQLAHAFVSSGFSYRQLVKAIVTSDVYRRVH
jgi:hypothetical protein